VRDIQPNTRNDVQVVFVLGAFESDGLWRWVVGMGFELKLVDFCQFGELRFEKVPE
jgi:hypothetical protein